MATYVAWLRRGRDEEDVEQHVAVRDDVKLTFGVRG
jgi:hypothetical protein